MSPDALFPSRQFSIYEARCLNRHSHTANCRGCADICPTRAITLTSGEVLLDESACINCGACLAACPTEVFAETAVPEDRLTKLVHDIKETSVMLACPLAVEASPQGKAAVCSSISPDVVMITPRCLAALAPSHLLQMANKGQRTLWLHDAPCGACSLSLSHAQLQTAVTEAARWLEKWGLVPAIHLESEQSPEVQTEKNWRPITRHSQFTGRRAFLRRLAGLEALEDEAAEAVKRLPRERQRLQAWWQETENKPEKIETEGLPITSIIIEAATCSACGLCAKQCPTAALTFSSDESLTFQIWFKASACLACGICAQACPETAVAYTDHLPANTLLSEQTGWLTGGLLQLCSACQARISQFSHHNRCHICRLQKSVPGFLTTSSNHKR